jgi:hypothetical protein
MDVLTQALKELKPGEEILCSLQTFQQIKDRLSNFRKSNRQVALIIRPDTGFQRIKRKE